MSSYGPQGGPYPGQPQDPWQDGSAGDPYRTGYPDPLTESSFVAGQYGNRPDHTPNSVSGEVWGPPQAPARQGRSGDAIAVIVVVVLLAIGGATTAAVLFTRGDNKAGPGPDGSAPPSSSAMSAAASSSANADAKVAAVGDCLVNKGSAKEPDMQKVTCAANTYQVLKRIDGTSDYKKCEGTPNLTDWYFFDHAQDAQDFVLCLRKR
ncbi:hypothetical protein GCM10009557_26580 [Virgisporangium ochraceum]